MSSVGCTATGRVKPEGNSESKAKIEPTTPAHYISKSVVSFNEKVSAYLWFWHVYVQSHLKILKKNLQIGILGNLAKIQKPDLLIWKLHPNTDGLSFGQVDEPASTDSYPKCKLKHSYGEKAFTWIKDSTFGGFFTVFRSPSNFWVFACKQWILSRCFCCRLFALSFYHTNTIHHIELTWKSPLQRRFVWLLVVIRVMRKLYR